MMNLTILTCIYFAGVIHTFIKDRMEYYYFTDDLFAGILMSIFWPLLYVVALILWIKGKLK